MQKMVLFQFKDFLNITFDSSFYIHFITLLPYGTKDNENLTLWLKLLLLFGNNRLSCCSYANKEFTFEHFFHITPVLYLSLIVFN